MHLGVKTKSATLAGQCVNGIVEHTPPTKNNNTYSLSVIMAFNNSAVVSDVNRKAVSLELCLGVYKRYLNNVKNQ